nr:MAG TPA_asm: hypothetical protein [Caudoviricetes sp.]
MRPLIIVTFCNRVHYYPQNLFINSYTKVVPVN